MSVTLSAPTPATNSEKNPCQPDPEKLKELEALVGKTNRAYKAMLSAQSKLDKAIKEHGVKSPEAHAARKVLKHAAREFEKLNGELQKKREEVLYPCGKDPSPEVPKKSEPESQPKPPADEKTAKDEKKLLDELRKQTRGEMLLRPNSLFKQRPAVPMPVDPKVPPNPKPDPIPPKAPEPKEPAAPK